MSSQHTERPQKLASIAPVVNAIVLHHGYHGDGGCVHGYSYSPTVGEDEKKITRKVFFGGRSLLSESKQRERERPREETAAKPEFCIRS